MPKRLRREYRRATDAQLANGWGHRELKPGVSIYKTGILKPGDTRPQMYWQYFCDQCGDELTPGPSGGGTNQVCEKCKVNFGCLPGALER